MSNDLKKSASIGTLKNPSYLLLAWKQIYAKADSTQREYTSGVDGVTLNKFSSDLRNNLKSISTEMLSDSGYQFSSLKPVFIKKKNGKDRLICIPTVADRIVQRSIQLVLQKNGDWKYAKFNGINFGFVKKKSVADAISRAVELRKRYPFVYKTDITSFFDSIDREELKSVISTKVRSKSLHRLLFKIVDCEIDNSDKTVAEKTKAMNIHIGRGIRQGMPLSPLVANLFLSGFDKQVREKKIWTVRYADDLIFFADNDDKCRKIHEFCKNELKKIKLEIPEIEEKTKTEIIPPEKDVEFLGISISYDFKKGYLPIVSKDQEAEIRSNILKYSDLDYLTTRKITLRNFSSIIRATIAGYHGVYKYCANVVEINNKMEQWVYKALKILLNTHYKINYDTLSEKEKSFLDVIH